MQKKQHTKGFNVKMPAEKDIPSTEKKQASKMKEESKKMPEAKGAPYKVDGAPEAAKLDTKKNGKLDQGEHLMDPKAMPELSHPPRGKKEPAISNRPANKGPFDELKGKMQGEAHAQKDYQAPDQKLELTKVKK